MAELAMSPTGLKINAIYREINKRGFFYYITVASDELLVFDSLIGSVEDSRVLNSSEARELAGRLTDIGGYNSYEQVEIRKLMNGDRLKEFEMKNPNIKEDSVQFYIKRDLENRARWFRARIPIKSELVKI